MKRLVFVTLVLAGACGGPHMGDNYGRRTRGAFDAQIAAKGGGGAIVMGDDAKTILMRHRGLEQTNTLYKSSGNSGAGASSMGSNPSAPAINMPAMASPGRLDAR